MVVGLDKQQLITTEVEECSRKRGERERESWRIGSAYVTIRSLKRKRGQSRGQKPMKQPSRKLRYNLQ